MAMTVIANDGVNLPIDSLNQTYTYTDGNVTSITVQYAGNTYKQTFNYTVGNVLSSITGWQKQ